jgi:hypothetical protein
MKCWASPGQNPNWFSQGGSSQNACVSYLFFFSLQSPTDLVLVIQKSIPYLKLRLILTPAKPLRPSSLVSYEMSSQNARKAPC